MSVVAITGASGLLGRALLGSVPAGVHSIRAFSRRAAAGRSRVEWTQVDLATGAGLDTALDGIDTIVHAASSPRRDTYRTDVEGTRRLLEAARAAGVRHVVYVSIVGVDRVPVSYYARKYEAERLVEQGAVPWSIVRATQFHDFAASLLDRMARLPVAIAPRGWRCQPVHVDEFADELWRRVADGPSGRTPDFAGPDVLTYEAMLRSWIAARGITRRVAALPIPGALSRAMRRGDATAPDRAVGALSWEAWLHARGARPRAAA